MNKKPDSMPQPEANGFVKTMNNMGYMTSSLDPFSQRFVAFSPTAPGPSLDVGAAYGVATLPALALGASVIANDIDARHLQILQDRVLPEYRDRLTTVAGSFPGGISFPDKALGAVLIARVLHFFSGETIEDAFSMVASWLAPGGKLFVVAETPYLKNFRTFIPVYEERRAAGHKWPGLVDNVAQYAPERAKFLPKTMHFLDPSVLKRVAESAGLFVERCETIARSDFPDDLRLDGRESVGLIARKPGELK